MCLRKNKYGHMIMAEFMDRAIQVLGCAWELRNNTFKLLLFNVVYDNKIQIPDSLSVSRVDFQDAV